MQNEETDLEDSLFEQENLERALVAMCWANSAGPFFWVAALMSAAAQFLAFTGVEDDQSDEEILEKFRDHAEWTLEWLRDLIELTRDQKRGEEDAPPGPPPPPPPPWRRGRRGRR